MGPSRAGEVIPNFYGMLNREEWSGSEFSGAGFSLWGWAYSDEPHRLKPASLKPLAGEL